MATVKTLVELVREITSGVSEEELTLYQDTIDDAQTRSTDPFKSSDSSEDASRKAKLPNANISFNPTSALRYNLMKLWTGTHYEHGGEAPFFPGVEFRCTNALQGNNGQALDIIVGALDMTVGGTPPTFNGPGFGVYSYWRIKWGGESGTIITKTIKLTYASGFTKTFTLSCSNNGQLIPGIVTGGGGALHMMAYDCGQSASNMGLYSYSNYNPARRDLTSYTDTYSVFVKVEPLENPSGLATETEIVWETLTSANSQHLAITSVLPKGHSGHQGPGGPNVQTLNQWVLSPYYLETGSQVTRFTIRPFSEQFPLRDANQITYPDASNIASLHPSFVSTSQPNGGGSPTIYSNMFTTAGVNSVYNFGAELFNVESIQDDRSMFVQQIIYAENLTDCVPGDNTYTVCESVGDPNFYQDTCLDCNGNIIPTNECNGTVNANFIHDNACCLNCELELVVSAVNSTCDGTDGYIRWDAASPPNSANPSGTTWPGYGEYTVTVVASNAAVLPQTQAPAGGATGSTTVTTSPGSSIVSIPSNAQITPGMHISGGGIPNGVAGAYVGDIVTGAVGNNVTAFYIVDNVGNPEFGLSANTQAGIYWTGFNGIFGNLEPNNAGGLGAGTWYQVTVTDYIGCSVSLSLTIGEDACTTGCTDNTAINYDATANYADDSCFFCNVNSDGQLTSTNGLLSGDLFSSTSSTVIDVTQSSGTIQTDGHISVTASMLNSAAAYLDLNSSESYTFELYPVGTQGDFTTAGAVSQTEALLLATTYGASPNHTFDNVAYGHYAIKVFLVDNDIVGGTNHLETCYTIFFATVKAPICADPSALNYNSANIPAGLWYADNSMCTYPVVCCVFNPIIVDTSTYGSACNPFLTTEVYCAPTSTGVTGHWEYNGVVIAGSTFSLGAVSNTWQTVVLWDSFNNNLIQGDGAYTCILTATYTGADPCSATSATYNYTTVVCGCTDPTANNYDPLATIDDGSCIYPAWDCISPGNCFDDGTGNGQWNSTNGGYSACQSSCLPLVYGCKTPCATNYDASADVDDGSCLYKACLDYTAYNQYWSCDCNQSLPNATQPDPSCCTYPCLSPATLSFTVTDASGSCNIPVADGSISTSVTLNNGGTTFTVTYQNSNTGVIQTYTCSSSCASSTHLISNLAPAVYIVTFTDNFGCIITNNIAVSSTIVNVGCTDPNADNWNPAATCDDGSCIVGGCTDPTATNYDPAATWDDGSCEYVIIQNPCIPEHIDIRLAELDICLSLKGTDWLLKYKIGTNDDCTLNNKWKLILIQYLLQQKDLTCLYNCADLSSQDPDTIESCASLAAAGGPVTGVNDQGYAGSISSGTSGTVITDPALYFVGGNTLYINDVITMPSGLIWQVVAPVSCTNGCENPESSLGGSSGNWIQCVAANNITITTSVNYIDNFLNFVNKCCQDCNITKGSGEGGHTKSNSSSSY